MATAIGTYATLAGVQGRITGLATSDNALVQTLSDQVNMFIEGYTGRVLAPISSTTYTFNGFDALENGRCLPIPRGIRSVSLLQVAVITGGTLTTIPSSDYFLLPTPQERDPGWPATELWITDIPSTSDTTPNFYSGFETVAVTGTFGWPAMPDDIVNVALNLTVTAYRRRGSSDTPTISVGADGTRTFESMLSTTDYRTLQRYKVRAAAIAVI